MRRSLSKNTLQISTDTHHLQTRTTQCRDLLSLRLDTYLWDNSSAQCIFSHNIQHQCRKGKPHTTYLKLVSHWAWTCISCKQSKCNVSSLQDCDVIYWIKQVLHNEMSTQVNKQLQTHQQKIHGWAESNLDWSKYNLQKAVTEEHYKGNY
jgi:hypothetical protein